MARGFAETLFAELDKRHAREQIDINRQQAAMENQERLQFEKDQAEANQTFRQDQLSLTREQLQQQQEQQKFQNSLAIANSIGQGNLVAADPTEPGAIVFGNGYVKPTDPQQRAQVAFEQQRKQTLAIANEYVDTVSQGDDAAKARLMFSPGYLKLAFGQEVIEPNLTTDQMFAQTVRKMHQLDGPSPDYEGAMNNIYKYNTIRQQASPTNIRLANELESDALAGAIGMAFAQERGPDFQPTYQDIVAKASEIVNRTHPGASEGYKAQLVSDATRKAGLNQGGLPKPPEKPATVREAIDGAMLENPQIKELLDRLRNPVVPNPVVPGQAAPAVQPGQSFIPNSGIGRKR